MAARERPDLRFVAVEGRYSLRQWFQQGVDFHRLGNLLWLRNRRDMRPVYRRTAILLAPSYWFEAAGRVAVEAQLSGVPVLATDRGGLREQLNGGGFLLEPPHACLDDYLCTPSGDDCRPWLERIESLLDDPGAYAAASDAARAAAAPFHPEARVPRLVRELEEVVAGG